jgi:hypothetical protein
VSADGSAVYFMAFGALTMAAQPLKEGTSFVGSVNLYRYDTVSDRTVFVAKINERNYPSTYLVNWWGKPLGEAALAPNANWYVTPDGNHLLFGSEVELTGQSTAEGSRCNGVDSFNSAPDGHCTEIYRYSYEPGSDSGGNVMCVSCDPSGANPVSNAVFGTFARRTTADAGPVRAMSDDGSYVFFDTADPLVSSDSNKTLDVYEWEAQGKGGCELAGGCVHLISSGTDSTGSYFLGMSPDGRNAFFGTHASLVPQDIDTYGDLYDARICEPENGNPCIKPPGGGTGQCAGDACQTLPSSPIDATPTSLTFSGAGNVRPGEGSGAKQKSLTRAQQLAKALKACRRLSKRKRVACEAQARKRYRVKSKAKRSRSRAGRSGRARRARGHGRGGQ